MRHPFLAFLTLMVLTTTAAAAAKDPVDILLPQAGKTARHVFGAVTLTIADPAGGNSARTITVTSPGAGSVSLLVARNPDPFAPPTVKLAEMDAANKTPEFIIQNPTGKDNCCTDLQFLDVVGGKWSVIRGGLWDTPRIPFEALDGDNELEFSMEDERFHYVFSCLACAAVPQRYFKLVDGAVTDISSSPIFRQKDEVLLADLEKACTKDDDTRADNGACASYVALGRRLGHGPEVWQHMLENYDDNSDWGLNYCVLTSPDGKCLIQGSFKTFPEALRAFLQRNEEWQPAPPPMQP